MGKQIYAPVQTAFDAAASTTAESFAAAQGERTIAAAALEIESALSRQTTAFTARPPPDSAEPDIVVPKRESCRIIKPFGSDTSCHIMNLTEADSVADSVLSTSYFPLIKEEYMPVVDGVQRGLKDRTYLGQKGANEYLSFDPVTFPSFCGKSATFSIWFESSGTAGGYILTRFRSSDTVWPEGEGQCWAQNLHDLLIDASKCTYAYTYTHRHTCTIQIHAQNVFKCMYARVFSAKTHTHMHAFESVNILTQARRHGDFAHSSTHPPTHTRTGQYWALYANRNGEIYVSDKCIHVYVTYGHTFSLFDVAYLYRYIHVYP